jgi:hypothetical protein
MIRLFAAGLVAFGALMTAGVGVANADEVEVDGNYSSEAGCAADAPHVELQRNDHLYSRWDCRFGNDGFWHVWLLT